ncbi:hypothetical protein ACA910_010120 [Epithemia clementina (nom. ined.)]
MLRDQTWLCCWIALNDFPACLDQKRCPREDFTNAHASLQSDRLRGTKALSSWLSISNASIASSTKEKRSRQLQSSAMRL